MINKTKLWMLFVIVTLLLVLPFTMAVDKTANETLLENISVEAKLATDPLEFKDNKQESGDWVYPGWGETAKKNEKNPIINRVAIALQKFFTALGL